MIRKHPTFINAEVWIADGVSKHNGAKLHFSIIRSERFDKLYWVSKNQAGYVGGLDGNPIPWETVEKYIESHF